jgi:hypothetical protein
VSCQARIKYLEICEAGEDNIINTENVTAITERLDMLAKEHIKKLGVIPLEKKRKYKMVKGYWGL